MYSTIRTMKEHNLLNACNRSMFTRCIDGGCLVPRTSGYVGTIITANGGKHHYARKTKKACIEAMEADIKKYCLT